MEEDNNRFYNFHRGSINKFHTSPYLDDTAVTLKLAYRNLRRISSRDLGGVSNTSLTFNCFRSLFCFLPFFCPKRYMIHWRYNTIYKLSIVKFSPVFSYTQKSFTSVKQMENPELNCLLFGVTLDHILCIFELLSHYNRLN